MLTARGKLSLLALAPCLAFLACTSREGRAQEGKVVPTDVRVVNPNTAPVFASVVNSASAPVQAKIVNALGAPVPANITNPATAPVQAKIVNGPASPVQTSLVGQPTVSSRQNGTWNVSVANPVTAPVRVRDAADSGVTFVRQVAFNIDTGAGSASAAFSLPPVAPGQKLLIEHVSLFGYVFYGQKAYRVYLQTANNEGPVHFQANGLPVVPQGTDGSNDFFAVSQVTHIYHDPSLGPLEINVSRYPTSYGGQCQATIHGRIIAGS